MRALRRRLGWRQIDLAEKAGCAQATVSAAERGHLPEVPLLRAMLAALDASLVLDVWWRAGALDRLLDQDHAALVTVITKLFADAGWDVRVEVTYNEFGDRGSIDVLAFMPANGLLVVIEIKTELASLEETLRKIDEKTRLAPELVRKRFGWDVQSVGWLLVMPELRTLRRRVEQNAALFDRVFPVRGRQIRKWLVKPTRPIAGLWFLSDIAAGSHMRKPGGRTRVRVAHDPPPIDAAVA